MAAFFKNTLNAIAGSFLKGPRIPSGFSQLPLIMPNRTKFVDCRMIRDHKRRQMVKEHAQERLLINALRYNTVLPKELQAIADKEIAAFPTNACLTKTHKRCILTSRARGRWRKFKMSRIIWRHFADYNKISGVERAMWSFSWHLPHQSQAKQ